MRVLVVTNLWPTPASPARGGFVRDQVEALRSIDGLEVELFTFGLGTGEYVRAARELRRRAYQRVDMLDRLACLELHRGGAAGGPQQ